MLFASLPVAALAAEGTDVAWSVGWDGLVKLGKWNTATAEVTVDGTQDYRLECTALDPEGHLATYVGPTVKGSAGRQRVSVPFQLGRPDSAVTLRLFINDQEAARTIVRPGSAGELRPTPLSERVIVSVGDVRSVTALAETPLQTKAHVIVRKTAIELPGTVAGYGSVDWLVITGTAAMPQPQSEAIRAWVRNGGRLAISIPRAITEFRSSPLMTWLPMTIGEEPVSVRDLGGLEAFANRNLRIPMTGRLQIAAVTAPDAVSLASSRNDQLLFRTPYGFGEIVVLSLDLTQPPLANWGGVNDLVRRMHELELVPTDEKSASANVRGQLTSTGISDLASQLNASLDHFPAVQRPSPWWSMVWMLAAVVVIGPLDYVIVHRLLRRPHWTWITLPLWLIAFAGVATSAGAGWNQAAARINQMDVVDVDAATETVRVNSFSTYYSPNTSRVDVIAKPQNPEAVAGGMSWFAIPEGTAGGLYRPGGAEWGRTSYEISPLSGRLTAMPVLQWGTRTTASQWTESASDLVDADLHSTGLGRLTGSLQHQLPGPVTDWLLAYGNRAYWRQVSRTDETVTPLEPGERLSIDDSLVFQGDLRSLLTRVVTTKELGERSTETRIVREQTRYDPTVRDWYRLWQIITYHNASGGILYTHLHNDLLTDADLTRQLQLGRAVLFGRLDAKSWITTTINREELPPDHGEVFVRLVLPVRRSGEIVRELPKFGAESK